MRWHKKVSTLEQVTVYSLVARHQFCKLCNTKRTVNYTVGQKNFACIRHNPHQTSSFIIVITVVKKLNYTRKTADIKKVILLSSTSPCIKKDERFVPYCDEVAGHACVTGYNFIWSLLMGCLGSRVVSLLDSGAEGPRFKSESRRCRVTVLGKLFTPIVPLFTKQQNW